MLRLIRFFLVSAILIFPAVLSAAEPSKTLKTRFATIHYNDEKEISDFLWRISGKRLAGGPIGEYTRTRVDEIVQRVTEVLDMHPPAFHFKIILEPVHRGGTIAYYSRESRSITAVSNRVTDGVLA